MPLLRWPALTWRGRRRSRSWESRAGVRSGLACPARSRGCGRPWRSKESDAPSDWNRQTRPTPILRAKPVLMISGPANPILPTNLAAESLAGA
jgi:hypothetical protein